MDISSFEPRSFGHAEWHVSDMLVILAFPALRTLKLRQDLLQRRHPRDQMGRIPPFCRLEAFRTTARIIVDGNLQIY